MQKHYNYLDIDLDSKIYRKLNAVQGDIKSRYILVNLYSNSMAYDLTSCAVRIYGIKKDKTIFFNNASIKDAKKGQFEIELTNQALAVAGELEIQVLLMGTNGERLTSSAFFIAVGESIVDEDAIESANEFGALTESLSKVDEWDEYFEETSGKIEEKYTERLNQHDEQFNQKVDKITGKGLSTNDYSNDDKLEVSKVANKADKVYVDTITQNIASGSPKGVYNTIEELRADKPTGASGIYLVRSDSNFYYWNDTDWTVGWKYLVDLAGSLKQATTLTNADNLNDVVTLGIYYIQSSSLPLNTPINVSGNLLVIRQTKSEYVFGITQIFYTSDDTYVRYSTSSGFGVWTRIATTKDMDTLRASSFTRKTTLTNLDDLNNINSLGIYYIQSSSLPLNCPIATSGNLAVFRQTNDSNFFGITQVVYNQNGIYFRYRTSSGYTEWKKNITEVPIGGYDYTITKDAINKTFKSWVLKGDLVNNSFGTTHKKGDIIPTLPYMSRFKNGRDILYNSTLSTFYSMVENPASDLYLSGDYGYFGAVCTTLSGYLCSQDIYYTSGELFDVLDIYDYNGGCSLRIGDNMIKEGHSRIITDILVDDTGKVKSIGIAEAGGPLLYYTLYTLQQFENLLKINGGDYILGRFSTYKPKELEKIEFPIDCIPNKGHKGIYKTGEQIKLYVDGDTDTLYYKKMEGTYSSVALSSLPTERINAVDVYVITSLITDNDVWCITTNTNNKPCLLLKCDTGSVDLNENTFTTNGYSNHLKPLWYQVNELTVSSSDAEYYPAPDGYIANVQYGNKNYVSESGTTPFTVKGEPVGYYIRVLYQTPFGQVFRDSDYVIS